MLFPGETRNWRASGLIVRAILAAATLSATSASLAADMLQYEFAKVQDSNYEALERAPVRHWGHAELQTPFWRVRNVLSRKEPHDPKAIARDVDEACRAVLRALCLEPAATLSFDGNRTLQIQPAKADLVLYQNVPSAVVLRVTPFGREGKLSSPAMESQGVKFEGQGIYVSTYYATYAVVPVVAGGPPGQREISLKVSTEDSDVAIPLQINVRPSGTLKGTVARRDDRTRLAAKLFVEDQQGRLYVVPGERNYRTQEWYAFFQPRFSYVEGRFAIPLPPGAYRVTAMKGYGYRDWEDSVTIQPDRDTECRIEMERLCPLEEAGWYSADMHVHGQTPLAMLRAEDVNVAANCHYSSHKPLALRVNEVESDATHLACSAQEIEHWNFGNAFYFGIPTTVQDPETPDPKMTPFFHYDEQAHKMGGITLRWLRSRPFSPEGGGQQQPEIAVDAALGYMDVWSVLDNSMQGALDRPDGRWTGEGWGRPPFYELTYKTWYRLLNCGLRVTASAGTSYGRLSRLGFNRVYARCAEGFGVNEFADALKRGNGFVTNGPLLWLRVNGRLPGEGVALDSPGEVRVTINLHSRYPVERVEILRNGNVVAERMLENFNGQLTWEETMRVGEPSWFAARCFGVYTPRYPHSASHNHFAHTNPLFVTIAGKRPASPADAAVFLKEIDALIEYAPKIPSEQLRSRSVEAFSKARQYYANMTD